MNTRELSKKFSAFRSLGEPIPPPKPLDPNLVMEEARRQAIHLGTIAVGIATWRESATLYRAFVRGQSINATAVWTSARRVGHSGMGAAMYASRRYMTVTGLDTVARLVAYNSARKAHKSALHKVLFAVSHRFAGKASVAVAGVEIFRGMHRDLVRFRDGELSQRTFVTNCALTGVSVMAPTAGGSIAGPAGATVGFAVSIGARMLKK